MESVVQKAPLIFYAFSIGAGFMAAVGDSLLKQWTKSESGWWWLSGGVVFWNISLMFFILMLQRGMLAQSVVMYIILNCVFALIMSRFIFGEVLSATQWSAIALAVFAVVLMELG